MQTEFVKKDDGEIEEVMTNIEAEEFWGSMSNVEFQDWYNGKYNSFPSEEEFETFRKNITRFREGYKKRYK